MLGFEKCFRNFIEQCSMLKLRGERKFMNARKNTLVSEEGSDCPKFSMQEELGRMHKILEWYEPLMLKDLTRQI